MKKIVLHGNNKPHLKSQLRKAIMKRSWFKNKANKTGRPADKTAYYTQRNLVVKLYEEWSQKIFLKKQNNRKCYKQRFFGNYATFFSLEKVFIIFRNLLLKLKQV